MENQDKIKTTYNQFLRKYGRKHDQLRNITIEFNSFGYAAGSVLFKIGNTKVLCSASLQNGVPQFLKGTKTGWLTAEYAMLPTSSKNRITRDASVMKRNGRAVEISRLIGRSLRTVVDLHLLGERTIYIDCDVLQADGSTRTACITGACLALRVAVEYWLKNKVIKESILKDTLAAVSVGLIDDQSLLDISYDEDSNADADFNFVLTKSGKVVEIQGGAEGDLISWDQFEKARALACSGVQQLLQTIDTYFEQRRALYAGYKQDVETDRDSDSDKKSKSKPAKTPFFSLQNR